jgi:hypothetical protein
MGDKMADPSDPEGMLLEQLERENPTKTRHFAVLPVKTVDAGWIWLKPYWTQWIGGKELGAPINYAGEPWI